MHDLGNHPFLCDVLGSFTQYSQPLIFGSYRRQPLHTDLKVTDLSSQSGIFIAQLIPVSKAGH